ncbi:hypothetical protein THAR02_02086 [Trichoderma harzianum]|uniref:Uncharacterized protein n=1 Tax=Trichoderma harzianum TaxID=5544 RepID=A0A0G0A0H2_TRIHA|nr:hypothetical protein THAR02_02086 [Trichoderma harzianum]
MNDQHPSSTKPPDIQCQPREGKLALGRWLAQDPKDDGVPYAWRETQETLTEETRSEGQAKDNDISVDCLHHVASYQAADEKNWSLASCFSPYHHQNTKGDCGQPSSNAHDTIESEDIFVHQQQEHLRTVLFPFSRQETCEQPFTQASMPSDPPGTADYSGTSYGAIQQNNEDDQWLDTPDATCIHGIISDRRRALLQHLGMLQPELSTIESPFASQQPFAPEHWVFNSDLHASPGYSMDGTFPTQTTESCFSRLDTNQSGGYTLPRHLVLVPSHSPENPSLKKQWGYGSPTIPSYSSDTHSRAMDDESSEMTFSTAPTTNKSFHRNNFGSYNLEPAQMLLSNMVNEFAYFFSI